MNLTTMKTSVITPKKRASYASDNARWNAVVGRDPKADGKFYSAKKEVKITVGGCG